MRVPGRSADDRKSVGTRSPDKKEQRRTAGAGVLLPGRERRRQRPDAAAMKRAPTHTPTARTSIAVQGARVHNLKNISVAIPRDSLTVVTGLSGSGKSSLAFDTIYAEGQRRYVESLSAYARQFLDQMERPEVDVIEGLSPAIAIEQKTTTRSPRSTVGT